MSFISHSTSRCLVPRNNRSVIVITLRFCSKSFPCGSLLWLVPPHSYQEPVLTLPAPGHWTQGCSAATSGGNICFPTGCTWQLPKRKRGSSKHSITGPVLKPVLGTGAAETGKPPYNPYQGQEALSCHALTSLVAGERWAWNQNPSLVSSGLLLSFMPPPCSSKGSAYLEHC